MRLGLNLGYAGADAGTAELVAAAERLGFAVVWAAEAYGSDAATVLAWVAAQTTRIDLGSAVFQIPARSPAMTAMTAATLDALSGGRFRLGLGVSGPQVSEGWHGVRFDRPLQRTREYVDIVRMALRRERVRYAGSHYQLPLPDSAGKPLRLLGRPTVRPVPLYLAAVGPRNLELAGELADGWLGIFFSPRHAEPTVAALRTGRHRVGKDLTGFDLATTVPLAVGDDVAACADRVRGYAALYLGGMGSREQNFYNAQARRMGFAAAAEVVQDRYLAGDQAGAAAAVPVEFLDQTSLLGPAERLAERLREYAAAGVTTLSLAVFADTQEDRISAVRTAAAALDRAAVGE